MDDPSQCRALNVSDEKRCVETATSVNGLFCNFHSRQCQGLYRGYKLRNAKLDRLTENPPKYLAGAKVPLHNLTYQDISTSDGLKEIHDYLFLKLQLLERVIRARRLHMSRFFSQDMDYGHVKYVEHLQAQRAATLVALEKLEKRTSEVLYKKQKWYTWVRECQDEEEKTRDKEQKKVKAEAAMFKRHWKAAQARQREMRAKEDKLRQDAFLEHIYKERMAERERNGEDMEDDDEMDWDPIEDVLEDSRGSYIDLIQTFLWMAASEIEAEVSTKDASSPSTASGENADSPSNMNTDVQDKPTASNTPKKGKPKAKKKKKAPTASQGKSVTNDPKEASANTPKPDKTLIETREEMYERLKNGEDYDTDGVVGLIVAGTIENPVISTKTITFPENEITRLQNEIVEIKLLLFCRLLLGHANLLPAALRANNLQEFFADDEVTAEALRDLCLKMENPGLQEIRDACADLFRADDEADEDVKMSNDDDNDDDSEDEDEEKSISRDMRMKPKKQKGDLPDKWVPKRDRTKKIAAAMGELPSLDSILGEDGKGNVVDFGNIQDPSQARTRKIKVKICGRTIWNYPSSKAMNRGGWLHFCIMAKESSLHDAIFLCRHWDEFFELNILAVWGYFPGKNWSRWVGNKWRQQMLQLGFIVYSESVSPDAKELQVKFSPANRGRANVVGAAFEARNFICAYIKRDDQASRRLVQYLAMQSNTLLVLVRDAETGRILIKPPEEERWLFRQKSGPPVRDNNRFGARRPPKENWKVIKSIGPEFFEDLEKWRGWNFSFKEYYDVFVWDLEAGQPFQNIYNNVQDLIVKALRVRVPQDFYMLAAPMLKTLSKDKVTHRVRDIKPGENVPSIYDNLYRPDVRFMYGVVKDSLGENKSGLARTEDVWTEGTQNETKHLFYGKADELEDEILFPEERAAQRLDPSQIGKIEPLSTWEQEGFSLQAFIEGWDSEYTEDTDGDSEDDIEDFDDDEEYLSDEEWAEDSDEIHDEMNTDPGKFADLMGFSDEMREVMENLSLNKLPSRKDRREIKKEDPEMEQEFMTYLDREKARIFKEVWHKADLSPHAQTRYIEMMKMTKKCRKYNHRIFDCPPVILAMKLVTELKIVDDKKDLHKAIAKLTPFFYKDFFASEHGEPFKDSLLFKQEERAKAPRDCRSHHSNSTRPAEFFKEYDQVTKAAESMQDFPDIWDLTCRPIIAHLYKCGILRTRADTYNEAQAFAAKEPGLDKWDFYQEQRHTIKEITMPPGMKNPADVPSFKAFSRAFAKKHLNARFAVLSLWSAPHFYPLMIGPDNHDPTSFQDCYGRTFIWKFVPKDMPCSEYSIHFAALQRIEPFKKYLGSNVVVKREKYLIMGKDEKDLFRLASVTAFAIQNRPWRQEVDLWKSFVNVDAAFIGELDDRWIE